MSDALATEPNPTKGAKATQGGTADVDKQPVPEQQKQVEKDPAKVLYPDKPEETAKSETKPDTEPEKGKEKAKPEEKPKNAPELYEFDVPDGMPEGFEKDEAVFDALAEVSRELDLTQESAQKLVDTVLPVMHRRAEEQQAEVHEKWVAEVKADKEIGGQKLDENLALAKRAVEAYASEGLQELLNGPLGSHPEVVRFLVKVGKTVSEDKFVAGERGGESVDLNDRAAMAKKLYPNSPA